MKKIHFLIYIYLLICGAVIYSSLINNNQMEKSISENRALTSKKDIIENTNFFDKQFQNTFNNLLCDQFPFKKEINVIGNYYSNLKCFASEKIDNTNELVLMKGGWASKIKNTDYYIGGPFIYNEEKESLLENRIWNFERIYEKYGDKYKMYIYKPFCVDEKDWFDYHYYSSAGEMCWNKFYSRLDGKYSILKQDFDTIEEYKDNHFKTDHHWNYKGAYSGYCDIINMMRQDYKEISEPHIIESIKKYDYPFYGTYSMHSCNTIGYDDFIVYNLDYNKDYSFYLDGKKIIALADGEDVFNSKKEEYIYEGYYGTNVKEFRIVNNKADNDLNLLIIGDSFLNCIKEDIAAHFKSVTIIDPRQFVDPSDPYNTYFSLDEFLENNNVDCILWLQSYTYLYFDSTCYLHINLDY